MAHRTMLRGLVSVVVTMVVLTDAIGHDPEELHFRATAVHWANRRSPQAKYAVLAPSDPGSRAARAADEPAGAPQPQTRPNRGSFQDEAGRVDKDRIVPHWFHNNTRFWYRNDLSGDRREFVLVDGECGTRQAAFDHQRLACSLAEAMGQPCAPHGLPFERIQFIDEGRAVRFIIDGTVWKCELETYPCSRTGDDPAAIAVGQTGAAPDDRSARQRWGRGRRLRESHNTNSATRSPDGNWSASVQDHNVFLQSTLDQSEFALSDDGRERLDYGRLSWAPDSKTLVAWRIEPGDRKEVYLVESSPPGGGRARLITRPYMLPGDAYPVYELNLFDVESRTQTKPDVEPVDFGSPRVRWNRDGRHFTYEKVDRGHQRFRLLEVDSHTGQHRCLIDERTDTFIWTAHTENVGVPLVTWLEQTDEIIYASERDGWRHLYLIDAVEGELKNPITRGEWVVRGIDYIDEEQRELWFRASGMCPDQDPYFIHHYRIRFDGTGLVALTDGNGTHTVQYSPDCKYLIDTWSRADMGPVHHLRRTSDGALVCPLEEADVSELLATGWQPPEVFVAPGRDGRTDIWGIICRPRSIDPNKKYPVIEDIYAGPQGSFVPKSFSSRNRYESLTELGFVVVKIDGMGTAHRSKAFHNVCWQNLKDAGLSARGATPSFPSGSGSDQGTSDRRSSAAVGDGSVRM